MLLRLKVRHLPSPQQRTFWLLGTDAVSIARLFAYTLEDRAFVYQPNVPGGNKPVTIGHQYSLQVVYPEKDHSSDPPWVYPLSTRRIRSEETAPAMGSEQMNALMEDETLPFHEELCVHIADSTYSAVLFLGSTEEHKNLVNVVRSRSNRVFYRQPLPLAGKRKPGRPPWYGERFCLKDPTTWGGPDAMEETTLTTRKGHTYRVQLEAWHDLLMRGKKDLPMDLYHQQLTEGNLIANLTLYAPWIGHFHAAGVPGRHELVGSELDYRSILATIEKIGYEGYVGLEFSPTIGEEAALKQALTLV